MTPKQKRAVLGLLPLNDKTTGSVWATMVENDRISASAQHRNGVVTLNLAVLLGQDNKSDGHARALAKKCARTFFNKPVMMRATHINWGARVPVFIFRERGRR